MYIRQNRKYDFRQYNEYKILFQRNIFLVREDSMSGLVKEGSVPELWNFRQRIQVAC